MSYAPKIQINNHIMVMLALHELETILSIP